jgi:hypothetical protein
VQLKSPAGKILFETKSKTKGQFFERVFETGEYEVCFIGLQKPSGNSKRQSVIEFDFKVKKYGESFLGVVVERILIVCRDVFGDG